VAAYTLLASSSTVQVLSPTVVNDVVYCTLETSPSSVIASIPVSQVAFDTNGAAEELTAFANNIEQLMKMPHVIAASGTQTLDAKGLLADQVAFVVEYVPTGVTDSNVTADAYVQVNLISVSDPAINKVLIAEAEAIINKTHASLKSLAGG
jgi:hypothetical protein